MTARRDAVRRPRRVGAVTDSFNDLHRFSQPSSCSLSQLCYTVSGPLWKQNSRVGWLVLNQSRLRDRSSQRALHFFFLKTPDSTDGTTKFFETGRARLPPSQMLVQRLSRSFALPQNSFEPDSPNGPHARRRAPMRYTAHHGNPHWHG